MGVRLVFDRGTLLFADVPASLDVGQIPGVLWDARVGAYRAPARLCYAIASELRRRGVQLAEQPCPTLTPPSEFRPLELRPYQEAAVAAWRQGGRRGLIVLPTGSGKTRIALHAIATTRTPCLCLVPTRALLGQWTSALTAIWDGPTGQFGDGLRVLGPVTVATFASAYRHMASIGNKFGLLIVDEAHHFGQGARDETLEMSIAPLRLGLTATPPAPGPAAKRLTSLVGPVVFERTIGDLAGRYLAPLERITWRLTLDPDERREHDALWETYRQSRRAFEGNHLGGSSAHGDPGRVPVPSRDGLRSAKPSYVHRWEEFLHHAARTDEGRRGIAAWRRARRILAFPRRKREALALLLGRHRNQRTLVFVADNETAYRVAREHLIMPLTCDIGRAEREVVLTRFRDGSLRALVSAQVLNEGIDVPDAEVGIVVAGWLGEREHVQRVGRLLRPGDGKRALVYELIVEHSSEVRQAERRWEGLASRERSAA